MHYVDKNEGNVSLLPNSKLIDACKHKNTYNIFINDNLKRLTVKNVDYIILCTGYEYKFPEFLRPIARKIETHNNKLHVDKDYSLNFNGDRTCRIFIQHGSKHTHGIADPNLSLLSYRSATILNAIVQDTVYSNIEGSPFIKYFIKQPISVLQSG